MQVTTYGFDLAKRVIGRRAHPGKMLASLGDEQGMLPYTLIISSTGYILHRH
ncbi:hypothetical protein HF292_010195 [Acidithiobacillus ferruginosus]|uniref:Uncharacterized protein n=1 Tax=Acidithiobacillus ferruginosus TaxID=3063951 RepID=A0ACD5IHK3_9PROT|nr:hypothetical protein [Acidithiobacillus ferruginosus]MBU2814691.1 hypothetical protein [Acidithiobacillus ferruginosus]